jgi:hypothetical protein
MHVRYRNREVHRDTGAPHRRHRHIDRQKKPPSSVDTDTRTPTLGKIQKAKEFGAPSSSYFSPIVLLADRLIFKFNAKIVNRKRGASPSKIAGDVVLFYVAQNRQRAGVERVRSSTFTLVAGRVTHHQLTRVVLLEQGLSTWQQSSICQAAPNESCPPDIQESSKPATHASDLVEHQQYAYARSQALVAVLGLCILLDKRGCSVSCILQSSTCWLCQIAHMQ